ncbi:MAG: hypothetical protein WBO35_03845 [Candidatus Saccharimonadales bacterium]
MWVLRWSGQGHLCPVSPGVVDVRRRTFRRRCGFDPRAMGAAERLPGLERQGRPVTPGCLRERIGHRCDARPAHSPAGQTAVGVVDPGRDRPAPRLGAGADPGRTEGIRRALGIRILDAMTLLP